jgi:hypothetical protein
MLCGAFVGVLKCYEDAATMKPLQKQRVFSFVSLSCSGYGVGSGGGDGFSVPLVSEGFPSLLCPRLCFHFLSSHNVFAVIIFAWAQSVSVPNVADALICYIFMLVVMAVMMMVIIITGGFFRKKMCCRQYILREFVELCLCASYFCMFGKVTKCINLGSERLLYGQHGPFIHIRSVKVGVGVGV